MKKKKEKLTKAEILKGAGEETAQKWTMHALSLGTPEQKEAQLLILKHTSIALLAGHIFNGVMNECGGEYNSNYLMAHLDVIKEEILDAVDELAKGISTGNVKLTQF